jgi:F-type H+-transporting ATPase subunit b
LKKLNKKQKNSADQLIKQAQESIEGEKRAAIQELKNHVADIAVQMAEKVLHSELEDKDKQNKLIERLLKETKL